MEHIIPNCVTPTQKPLLLLVDVKLTLPARCTHTTLLTQYVVNARHRWTMVTLRIKGGGRFLTELRKNILNRKCEPSLNTYAAATCMTGAGTNEGSEMREGQRSPVVREGTASGKRDQGGKYAIRNMALKDKERPLLQVAWNSKRWFY